MDISRLINPRSIAVVGATDRPGSYAHTTLLNLIRNGYAGTVIGVHPTRQEVLSFRCVPSLADLNEPVDAVVIATPAESVPGYLSQSRDLGCGGAVVFAAGFAEIGNDLAQADLITAAGELPVIGPNGNGLVSVPARAALWGDAALLPTDAGPIALITQSGNIGVILLAHRGGLGLHSIFSVGNSAVVDTAMLIESLATTDGVRVIGAYLEGDGDGARLARALAKCAQNDIRLVFLKAGRSSRGRAAGAAHTAAVAGDQRVFEALIEEAGGLLVREPAELIETARALANGRRDARGAGVVTCSGGDATLAADLADDAGAILADFGARTLQALAGLLPNTATATNPLDHTNMVWADTEAVAAICETVALDPAVGHLLYVQDLPPGLPAGPRAEWDATRAGGIAGGIRAQLSTLLVSSMPGQEPDNAVGGLLSAMKAVAALQLPAPDPARLLQIAECANRAPATVSAQYLAEHSAKELLSAAGIAVPKAKVVRGSAAAAAAAVEIGFPVAVKLSAPGLLHKSDIGALALGLTNPEAVARASEKMLQIAALPDDPQLLVEAMVDPGVEIFVAAHRLGIVPCVVVGIGGIWAEIINDVTVIALPTDNNRVVREIGHLRGAELLTGGRGQPAYGIDELAQLVVKTGNLLLDENWTMIELNPVIVNNSTAIAVDAVIHR
ncbi:acyl-CoA synthetase [Actinomycetes bacterium]|nr:acyl-CoA synthetase [Actinomycetes bacterium]